MSVTAAMAKRGTSSKRHRTWAEVHARDFERLALDYVREHVGLPVTFDDLTAATRDGGFDGVLFFDVATALDLRGSLVIEAKLREPGSEPVGVDVVRATFAVAMYRNAHHLILATNTRYSKPAHEELNRFTAKWGLQGKIVEGNDFADWLGDATADRFPPELVDRLRDPSSYRVTVAAPTRKSHRRAAPAPDDLSTFVAKYPLTTDRVAILEATLNTLPAHSEGAIMTIAGTAGTGKTVFLKHAAHELERRGWTVEILPVAQLLTIQNIFAHVLVSITGLDRAALFGPTVAHVVERFMVETLSVSSTAAAEFATTLWNDGTTRPLLPDYTLLAFITAVVRNSPGRAPRAFILSDLGGSSPEVLHFTRMLAEHLATNRVTSLVEMPPFEFPEAERFVDTWKQSVRSFDNIKLHSFTDTDIIEFFRFHGIALKSDEMESVVTIFGRNPLCLARVAAEISAGNPPKRLRASGCDALIDNAISALVRRHGESMLRVCIASALLDGHLERAVVAPFLGTAAYALFVDDLTRASVFRRSNHGLECDHQRILGRLEILVSDHPEVSREVAETLLSVIPSGDVRRLSLLRVAEQWKPFIREALHHGRRQSRGRELTSSGLLISEADAVARMNLLPDDPDTKLLQQETLIELVNSESMQVYLGLEESVDSTRESQLREGLESGVFAAALPSSVVLTAYEALWRILFAGEEFDDALPLSKAASEYVDDNTPNDDTLRARARRMYAITLRAAGKPDEAIHQLLALDVQGEAANLVKAHIASLSAAGLLNTDPRMAAVYYVNASQQFARSEDSFLEYIRSLLDIALANYSAGEWSQAHADAEHARQHAEAARLSIEEGRALNVIACVAWVGGNSASALSMWKRLVEDLTTARAKWPLRRLAWRYWSNFATALARNGNLDAVAAAQNAVAIILSDSAQRLPLTRQTNYRATRWYAALLACAIVFRRYAPPEWEKLRKQVTEPIFEDDTQVLEDGALPLGVFGQRAFEESATLLITG